MNMNFICHKSDSKIYDTYVHETYGFECILIVGKTQEGNDYIVANALQILNNLFEIVTMQNKLIWLHGHGPSPHFILHRSNSDIDLDHFQLENFIKSKCPTKSLTDMPLVCSILSDVKRTNVKGQVIVEHGVKLAKLLKNM